MKDFDLDSNDQLLNEFFKHIKDILKQLNISNNNDDPYENIIESLGKIESQLHYYCEIRNYMHQNKEKEVNNLEKVIQTKRAN